MAVNSPPHAAAVHAAVPPGVSGRFRFVIPMFSVGLEPGFWSKEGLRSHWGGGGVGGGSTGGREL